MAGVTAAANAANDIHRRVSDDGLLGFSRNDNLQAIRGDLSRLDAQDRDVAVSKLSDADLEALDADVNAGGIAGQRGLSVDQRTDLYNSLASGLSGRQLARVARSIADPDNVQAFGSAVATHATSTAKVEFVAQMASQTTGNATGAFHPGFGSSTSELYNPRAQAVGQVLGSLKGDGAHFNQAIHALSDDQLAAVLKASAQPGSSTMSAGEASATTYSYDPKPLVAVLDAAATSPDPAVKARVFAAAATVQKEIVAGESLLANNPGAGAAARAVEGGLQRVLDSDVTGVVDQLRIQERTGESLTTYVQQQVAQGPGGQTVVGAEIARLQRGNDLRADPIAYMEAQSPGTSGKLFYRNATNLGYFSGAAQAAVSKQASAASDQATIVGNIFSSALGLATSAAGPYVGAAVKLASGQAVTDVAKSIKSGQMQLAGAFERLAIPRDARSNANYEGPATADFEAATGWVIRDNTR